MHVINKIYINQLMETPDPTSTAIFTITGMKDGNFQLAQNLKQKNDKIKILEYLTDQPQKEQIEFIQKIIFNPNLDNLHYVIVTDDVPHLKKQLPNHYIKTIDLSL